MELFFTTIGHMLNGALVLGKSAVNTFSNAAQGQPTTAALALGFLAAFVSWAILNREDKHDRSNYLMRKFNMARDSWTDRQICNAGNLGIALVIGSAVCGGVLAAYGVDVEERDRYHRQIPAAQSARPAQPAYQRPDSLPANGNGSDNKRHEEEIVESAPARPGTGRCVFTLDRSKPPCP